MWCINNENNLKKMKASIFLTFIFSITLRGAIAVLTTLYNLTGVWSILYLFVGVAFVIAARKQPANSWWEHAYIFHAAIWTIASVCVAANTPWCATAFLILDATVGAILWGFVPEIEEQEPLLGII